MGKNKEKPNTYSQGKRKHISTRRSEKAIKDALLDNLYFKLAKVPLNATKNDWYLALAYTVRDRIMPQWIKTLQNFTEDITIVAYLSNEFLMGPQLGINLINFGIYDDVFQAVKGLGLNLEEIIEHEEEPGLGNGGIGRLAACSIDSLATLEIPAIGYGVRYEFGSFDQEIRDGFQVEMTNKWLHPGNPWEIPRPEITYQVNLGGRTESYYDEQNLYRVRWIPKFSIKGIAYDTPITGYRANTTDLLRLWKSEAIESFDFDAFKLGDYFSAVNEKVASESISKILYPHDEPYIGKQLRLAQHYFFVSCSLQDMIRLHLMRWKNISTFSTSFAVQLNDTPPSIAVAELMRLLVDEHMVNWDKAWYITQNTFSYTNHTLLPEALEKWPLPLFGGILPRHLEIIYEINRRFLDEVWLKYPDDSDRLLRLSLIEESDQKYVRMAHLANLGSHIINGIAEPCTDSLKKTVFQDFYELYPEKFLNVTSGVSPRRWIVLSNPRLAELIPEKFLNVTSGVSPRRWIVLSNPRLAELITNTIGDRWIRSMDKEIKELEHFADDAAFIKKWRSIKYNNKRDLADIINDRTGISVNPDSLFDIQVKRFNEYKRHHL
ncbi:MAG: glycogen/starch/alpha-glucan family phosphorylase, partial [Candidatus Hermodarchaeia archaeon]